MAAHAINPRELVDALGGVTKASAILGERHPSAISNWVKTGRFPASKYLRHSQLLLTHGITANPSIWFGVNAEAAE